MQPACPHDLVEIALDPRDPFLDEPPVGFQLGFAGAAEKAEPAALALEMRPRSHEPALLVFEMRQLDLQRAFPGARPLPEDLEDQPGAVDDLGLEGPLEIALLPRRQLGIDDHEIDRVLGDHRGDFGHLARSEQR